MKIITNKIQENKMSHPIELMNIIFSGIIEEINNYDFCMKVKRLTEPFSSVSPESETSH